MRFGFHEAPHATAFGKILLADLDAPARDAYLDRHGLRALAANTMTEKAALNGTSTGRPRRGGLGERGVPGRLGVRGGPGPRPRLSLIGAVAVSAQVDRFPLYDARLTAPAPSGGLPGRGPPAGGR